MQNNINTGSENRTRYYCPMHCEGDKIYDKPGTCPVCNMFLVPVEGKGSSATGMNHAHHLCNCHESSHEKSERAATNHGENEIPRIVYYCPMHCEGDKTYDKPGTCPVCNMFLVAGLSSEIKKKSLK